MDYPKGGLKYSVTELMSFRSLPRQSIMPNQDVLARLKTLGILKYRGKRSGVANKSTSCKPIVYQKGVNLSNLTYPKIVNTIKSQSEPITCINANCRSVVKKDIEIGQYLRENKIDFAVLSETWYSDEKQHQFECSDLNQRGYKINVANRQNRIGGGLALVTRSNANIVKIRNDSNRSFEYAIWKLIFKNITIHVVGVYRPPSLATVSQFISDFCDFSESVLPQYSNIFMTGDFNIHIDEENRPVLDFLDSLTALGLEQHVKFGTHIGGHVLDLVLTEAVKGIKVNKCERGPLISDHHIVKVTLGIEKENVIRKVVTKRDFRKINKESFSKDICNIQIDSEEVDDYVQAFTEQLETMIDKHAPAKDKVKVCRPPKPWFDEDIYNLKLSVRKAEQLMLRYGTDKHKAEYKILRTKYANAIKHQKTQTLNDKIFEAQGNTKQLYQLVSELTGTKSSNPLPQSESEQELSEQFADFFLNKIQKIRDALSEFENYRPKQKSAPLVNAFEELTQKEVHELISSMKSTSCELDVLPTEVLKAHIDSMLPHITKLVNLSLGQGIFPSTYKHAIVKPLLKKAGLELNLSNYRPVSNLSFLSKLIEKSVLLRLNAHTDANNLLPANQSAYRRNHSCESALLRLVNDLLAGMENQKVTAMIAIDLSAAFDTVDHNILVDVLMAQYGLQDLAVAWIESYLRDRTCSVRVQEAVSTARPLTCSVPQGSCLGPWLYLAYAGTLFDEIPPSISVFGFADDHIAKTTFKPATQEEQTTIRNLESCAFTINHWMNANKLKMNTSKTEFILFGSQQQLGKTETTEINIAGDIIQRDSTIRYLGAYLDETLSFRKHVSVKCRSAMINYFRIKSIRKYLDQKSTEILVVSLVLSHLDYCNAILYGISESEIKKMQRVQNMSAKLVLKLSKFDSSKKALYRLHWLPIKARITFKVLTTMYKCSTNEAPIYLTELLTRQTPQRHGLRSSVTAENKYLVPFNRRKTFSDRSFNTVGPKLWNTLPTDIRHSDSLDKFKKSLKTHMFRNFYDYF